MVCLGDDDDQSEMGIAEGGKEDMNERARRDE